MVTRAYPVEGPVILTPVAERNEKIIDSNSEHVWYRVFVQFQWYGDVNITGEGLLILT